MANGTKQKAAAMELKAHFSAHDIEVEKNKAVQWIDIEKPNGKDLVSLGKKFGLHPVILDELREPSARARAEAFDSYIFFVYYFPLYDLEDEASVRTEIDFIVTKDTVVTVHYDVMKDVFSGFDIGKQKNSLELMYAMLEHLMSFEERQIRHIREKVEMIGREIFKDKEKEVLERITYLKRDISEYRIVVRLQGHILNSLLSKGKTFWNSDAEIYLNDLGAAHAKIVNEIEDYREAVRDFEDTNNQLMNLKINSVMKTFTALSFLTFPFVLIASLFSMRTQDTPIINLPYAFWIIFGIMIIGMASLAIYFRKKKWF